MQEKSWTYLDRSSWPKGEWSDEPDKMQWQDETTGLPCLIVRNRMGALCGYVGVAEGHPAFDVHYDEVNVDVHGGLTFADFCQPNDGDEGICHVPDEGEPERVYWLGFDCAHCWDVTPAWPDGFGEGSYKNIPYVQNECRQLAAQLAAQKETNVQ